MPTPEIKRSPSQAKIAQTELRVNRGDRAVLATISTNSVDRDGDVMLPSGVKLDNFRRHPVVLLGHDPRGLPIGRVQGIDTQPDAIIAKVHMEPRPPSLPSNVEWVPDTLMDLFEQDAPLAFSVGFGIEAGRFATKADRANFGDKVERVITAWELQELSVVSVPANQDALVMAVSKCRGPVGWTRNALGLSGTTTRVRYRSWGGRELVVDDPPAFRV